MDRRSFLASTAISIIAAQTAAAESSAWPSRPIKVIVPFPPGGAADTTIRLLEPSLRERLGQPLMVDNKPGANGIVGATLAAKAQPDGHTLLFAAREVFSVNPVLQPNMSYDPVKDFVSIGIATEGSYVLVVHPSVGVRTLADFVALAKTKSLAYASFGHGSMAQLNMEALARHAEIKLLHVPFQGAPGAVQAVARGDVAISIATPPAAAGLLSEGKLIALAIGSKTRSELMPQVPTLAESGFPVHLLVPASFSMAAPAGTPAAIVSSLNQALNHALADASVKERLAKMGLRVRGGSSDEMSRSIADDIANFRVLTKAAGIKAE
jgi:tripartite-type tricarboxylate transporter receptor subunit TctC